MARHGGNFHVVTDDPFRGHEDDVLGALMVFPGDGYELAVIGHDWINGFRAHPWYGAVILKLSLAIELDDASVHDGCAARLALHSEEVDISIPVEYGCPY